MGEGQERNLCGEEVCLQHISLVFGGWDVALPATIMLHGWANIPANNTMCTKWRTGIGRNVGNNLGSRPGNGIPITVLVAKEGRVGRKGRVNAGQTQEIECEQSLREVTIPFAKRTFSVNSAKDGDEMVF
jgi:hypothetical protein